MSNTENHENHENQPTKNKKIIVTGGYGLVGQAIQTIVQQQKQKNSLDIVENQDAYLFLSSKDYDLTSMEQTQQLFQTHQPTHVIHLAANVGGLFKNMNHKVDMLEKNLAINYNVIKTAHQYKVQKLVACLSTCIFPDAVPTYPITEEMLHDGPPHPSNDAYAYAKRMLEIHCRAYRENYGDNFVCVSPTNVYGPHDNFNLEDGHVLPALIHKCFLAKESNTDFVIRGTGKPMRQFIYSEDLAQMMLTVLFSQNTPGNLILSSPEEAEISIGEVATQIAKCFDYESRMRMDASFSDGQFKKTVSNEKIMRIMPPTFQYTSMEDGIRKTVEWFLNTENKRV
jgi:GDP-L-fucose synthase